LKVGLRMLMYNHEIKNRADVFAYYPLGLVAF